MDDDVLKKAYRRAHKATHAPHVSETEWEGLACGDLPNADRDRLLAHIMTCAECAEVHRSLLTFGTEAAVFDAGVPRVAAAPTAMRWAYVGGLAAAAAIIAAVVINRPAPDRGNADVIRSSAAGSSIELVSPTSGSPLANRHIAWRAATGADAYEIRVNSADGGAVWTARVTAIEADIPSSVTLTAGTYYCQVTGFKESTAISSSALVPFLIK